MSDLSGDQSAPDSAEVAEVVAGLDTPRSELIARAYHLHHVQGQTVTYTAQKLGVSRATAWRYAQQGAAQAKFLRSTDEEVQQALADGARWLAGALAAEQETVGGEWLDYAPVLLKVFEFEAKIRRVLAAQDADQGRNGIRPDPTVVAAIEATLREQGPSNGIAPQH